VRSVPRRTEAAAAATATLAATKVVRHTPGRALPAERPWLASPVRVAAVAGLVVAVGVLAAAAGGERGDVAVALPDPGPALDVVLLVGMVLGAVLGAVMMAVRRGGRPSPAERRRRHLVVFLWLVIAILVAGRLGPLASRGADEPALDDPAPDTGAPAPPEPSEEPPAGTRTVPIGVVLLATAALGGAAVLLTRRPAAPAAATPVAVGPPVAQLLDDAVDAVRADPDPRRAVLRCFAALEVVLAGHGLGRDPAETPRVWLTRVAADLGAGEAAARELAWTFERARFSTEPIDGVDRARALAALVAVRDGLRVPA